MTAFAHAAGYHAPFHWQWELKSVNAKGLDVRLRLPQGFDAIDTQVRARLARLFTRGTLYLTLTLTRDARQPEVRINQPALQALIAAVEGLPPHQLGPASLDGLLAIKGIVDVHESVESAEVMAGAQAAVLEGLDQALSAALSMRASEGQVLAAHLMSRMENLAALTARAEHHPARRSEAVRARLQQNIEALVQNAAPFDAQRLHQEAVLLAAKADVREELDRLSAHIGAVRQLMTSAEAVGRKLDFLAQELAREANTFCAKANDAALTALGMDMRVEIEQFREQVQNIE
jgi:uncharacterized protein (TIGR00255 family)